MAGPYQGSTGRVLVIFPGALGDLICFAPTLAAIHGRHRGSKIDLMARGELARLAERRLGVDHGYSIDGREVSRLFSGSAVPSGEARRLFGRFERIYSWFASSDPSYRRGLIAASGCPVTFHPFRRSGEGHISGLYLASIGERRSRAGARLRLLAGDLAEARGVLADAGLSPRGYVVLFPGSGSAGKNWPQTKFLSLARMISGETRPVFVLGPAELEAGANYSFEGFKVLRDLDLATVAAIAHLSRGFVGNDSGVSHLAAAAGATGVVLFGPTDPKRWRPLGTPSMIHRIPIETIEVSEVSAALFSPAGVEDRSGRLLSRSSDRLLDPAGRRRLI